MSLVPEFEIGLWNGWILVLFLLLHATILTVIFKKTSQKMDTEEDFPYQGLERKADSFRKVILLVAFIYGIFLPLKLETPWLYIGIIIFILGLFAYTVVIINWATTPLDRPVTKGLYRFPRHPMYITQYIAFIGIGIASASWLFLLLIILFATAVSMLSSREERLCIKRYGDAYKEYMDKTPKLMGLSK